MDQQQHFRENIAYHTRPSPPFSNDELGNISRRTLPFSKAPPVQPNSPARRACRRSTHPAIRWTFVRSPQLTPASHRPPSRDSVAAEGSRYTVASSRLAEFVAAWSTPEAPAPRLPCQELQIPAPPAVVSPVPVGRCSPGVGLVPSRTAPPLGSSCFARGSSIRSDPPFGTVPVTVARPA